MTDFRIAVTGASGFVGQALCNALVERGSSLNAIVRSDGSMRQRKGGLVKILALGKLSAKTDWSTALTEVSHVIHCAGRAHVMKESRSNAIAAYRATNVDVTLNLARQAAEAGIKRFIFISSIKVNGESTSPGKAFKDTDTPNPLDAYGISKMEAELGLHEISCETGMEVVYIRPPLVYGAGVKGNFLTMMRLLNRGLPLPFGAIRNRRSMVALDNLVDLVINCLDNPAAANQTFLVSDDEDLSTTELLQRLAKMLGRPARLISVSPLLLEWGASLFGKEDIAQRLIGNLQVDIRKTKELLGWYPPVKVDEGLSKAAEWYMRQR